MAIPLEFFPSRRGPQQAPTLLCSIGRDYRFRQHNPAWESLLGLSSQELRAKNFLDWLHPDDRDVVQEEFRRLSTSGDAVSFDARVSSRESHYRRFAWSAFDLQDSQGLYAIGRECPEPELRPEEARIRLPSTPDAIVFLSGESRVALVSSETAAVRRLLKTDAGTRGLDVILPLGRLAPDSPSSAPVELLLGAPHRAGAADPAPLAEGRWAAAAEHGPQAVILRDSEDIVRGWNHAAERLYGYRAREILGRPMTQLLAPECAAEDRRVQARVQRRESLPAYDTERLRKDGTRIDVSVSVGLLPGIPGAASPVVEISHEISERKREERRLVGEAEDLLRSNAELREYGSILSHDLQEPLHALLSYLGDLRSRYQGRLDEDGTELLAFAQECGEWMQRLTRDLLEHERPPGRSEEAATLNMEKLLDEVLLHLRPQIQSAGARILRGVLPEVTAQKTGIGQVLQNLVSNALKFRRAQPPQIQIEAEGRPGEVLFRVEDNGAGIEASRLRHLFRPSIRRDGDDPYPGFGMGLAIASRIVERQGGRIWAESAPGRGSTFFFTLPRPRERG